eukprot:scaffold680518_cov84-Prasinocladus_malaysianus.AAC.1
MKLSCIQLQAQSPCPLCVDLHVDSDLTFNVLWGPAVLKSDAASIYTMLNWSQLMPICQNGWSKVVEIIGGNGAPLDYSLYTDITYT